MNRFSIMWTALLVIFASSAACTEKPSDPIDQPTEDKDIALAIRNIDRAVLLVDATREYYFEGKAMHRYYNPYTGSRSSELGSVWMYSSAIQASTAILHALNDLKDAGYPEPYAKYSGTVTNTLAELVGGLEWYEGTFTLVSYTQTKEWTVYGVDRGLSPHTARVDGIYNVYDDQEWLVRDLIEAWKATGEKEYLKKAEYLASYVLDGWDCTLKSDGSEHGGITWGPGYYTKHSCSNGPLISPLVWLYEIYKGSGEQIEYRYIGADKQRLTKMMDKDEYYLMFARKVYDFQRSRLYSPTYGVYYDMLGAKGFGGDNIAYEIINGVKYRANNQEENPCGEYYTYNTGTMLSGAAELYRVTGEAEYLEHLTRTSTTAFTYFAKASSSRQGCYDYPVTGFSNWFNTVLLRGWTDASQHYPNVDLNIMSFQNNLDYAWENNLYKNQLPNNLLQSWNTNREKCQMEGMFEFSYAYDYAEIARYLVKKSKQNN